MLYANKFPLIFMQYCDKFRFLCHVLTFWIFKRNESNTRFNYLSWGELMTEKCICSGEGVPPIHVKTYIGEWGST